VFAVAVINGAYQRAAASQVNPDFIVSRSDPLSPGTDSTARPAPSF
jgi:hypothetical protein